MIVGVLPGEVESMLAAGLGPGPPAGARCPACEAPVRGCWSGYRRLVRIAGRVVALRIARTRCAGCRRTHALIPSFVVPGRLDGAPALLGALLAGARGWGHRRITARLTLPETTVRGWCRRLRAGADALVARLVALASVLGAPIGRSPPPGRPALAGVARALGALRRAARRLFGPAGLVDAAGLLVAATAGRLLAHMISP